MLNPVQENVKGERKMKGLAFEITREAQSCHNKHLNRQAGDILFFFSVNNSLQKTKTVCKSTSQYFLTSTTCLWKIICLSHKYILVVQCVYNCDDETFYSLFVFGLFMGFVDNEKNMKCQSP